MNKKKVLIIDDEVAFTNIVKLTLEMRDKYEVCAENNPLSAIETARKFGPDIIILDVIMPVLDGGEVYTELMADPYLSHIPIMFLTAIVRKEEVDEHKGLFGGRFFIAKPISTDGLIQAIDEHVYA
jgi:CheY-like chemotaxis protein